MNFEGLNELDGLQFVPVNEAKQPIVKDWQTAKSKHNLKNTWGVGLVCGAPSGNVECLDIDLKYDLTGTLYERYKRLIHDMEPNLLSKLVVQKTKSGGYHFVYRCSTIAGNMKLANRATIENEREDTYKKTYKAELAKHGDDDKAKKIADKARENDKVRVLFETRGIGGQFVCSPTPGYEFVHGDIYSITEISIHERDVLHGIARQFNEVYEEVSMPKSKQPRIKGKSPFDEYNSSDDVIDLLVSHGWQVVKNKGAKTIFLRPGQTTSLSSGNFDHDKRWFSVFTTSTEFDPQKAYLPYAVFAILECNKDFSEAYHKLLELGYGEKPEAKAPAKESTRVIKSRVDPNDEDYSFLATAADYDEYLQQVRDGTLQQGLTTGSPELDKYFLFKRGELVMTNGIDNTGKSVFTWWLMLIAALYHGWKGIIFSSENTLGAFMRKQIQFYWGKPLNGIYQMNETEYAIAKRFVETHFKLIRAQEDLYNYKDIINMVKKTQKIGTFDYGMIDPYNSLKIDLSGFSKLSTHEYHYEALSEIKAFGQQNNFGWILNNHAVTSALRQKDGDRKYPVAPRKEDTEGGGKFPNKADSFITIHRLTQHPDDWMVTELHVRKIKDTETGGRPTPLEAPAKFEMYKGGCAFKERKEDGSRAIDPIAEWHIKNGSMQEEIKFAEQKINKAFGRNMWSPFPTDKDDDNPF